MNVLIVSATKQEILPFIASFKNVECINNKLCFVNTNSGNKLYFLFTGIGMVATTFELTTFLSNYTIDLLINAGIAGAVDTLKIGNVVNVVTDMFYELGAETEDGFISIHDMKLLTESDYPLNELQIPFHINKTSIELDKLTKANGVTVSKVHGNSQSINILKKRILQLNSNLPFIESMEGAAVGYVSTKMNVQCIQLRAVSNMVEPRNRDNWNIPLAINNLNEALKSYLVNI